MPSANRSGIPALLLGINILAWGPRSRSMRRPFTSRNKAKAAKSNTWSWGLSSLRKSTSEWNNNCPKWNRTMSFWEHNWGKQNKNSKKRKAELSLFVSWTTHSNCRLRSWRQSWRAANKLAWLFKPAWISWHKKWGCQMCSCTRKHRRSIISLCNCIRKQNKSNSWLRLMKQRIVFGRRKSLNWSKHCYKISMRKNCFYRSTLKPRNK